MSLRRHRRAPAATLLLCNGGAPDFSPSKLNEPLPRGKSPSEGAADPRPGCTSLPCPPAHGMPSPPAVRGCVNPAGSGRATGGTRCLKATLFSGTDLPLGHLYFFSPLLCAKGTGACFLPWLLSFLEQGEEGMKRGKACGVSLGQQGFDGTAAKGRLNPASLHWGGKPSSHV